LRYLWKRGNIEIVEQGAKSSKIKNKKGIKKMKKMATYQKEIMFKGVETVSSKIIFETTTGRILLVNGDTVVKIGEKFYQV
jgi:hypothetical protein